MLAEGAQGRLKRYCRRHFDIPHAAPHCAYNNLTFANSSDPLTREHCRLSLLSKSACRQAKANIMNIRNTALRAPILAASLALLISPATSVIALADGVTSREPVRYGDLDLATIGGRATLESRIRKAASRVCDDGGDWRNLAAAQDTRSCREAAFALGMVEADALSEVAVKAALIPVSRSTAP